MILETELFFQMELARLEFASDGRIQQDRRILKVKELLKRLDEIGEDAEFLPERKRILEVGSGNVEHVHHLRLRASTSAVTF